MHIYIFFVIINVTISTIYSLFFDQIKIIYEREKNQNRFYPFYLF